MCKDEAAIDINEIYDVVELLCCTDNGYPSIDSDYSLFVNGERKKRIAF